MKRKIKKQICEKISHKQENDIAIFVTDKELLFRINAVKNFQKSV
jgi:hypothetical protein